MDRHDAQFVRAEEAEFQRRKAEAHGDELESQLQDAESEYNANWAVQAISDVARLVGVYEQCRETGDDIGAATLEAVQDLKSEKEQAEAEKAQVTAERDWLASWGDAHPCCMDLQCPFGRTIEQCEAREGGMLDSTECWQEAARRAVSAQESVVTTTTCPACKGKGGAEYEPGLITYACNACGGTGVVETRRAVEGEPS